MEDFEYSNEQVEEICNWTFSGLVMYYRDAQLSNEVIAKYEVRKIIRSPFFVDVSPFAGKMARNCRFAIASSKAAPLYQINSEKNSNDERWRLHTINANSYFKVLDIYQKYDRTQFFLLHIPANGFNFFINNRIFVGGENMEDQIIKKSRMSFDKKMEMKIIPEFEEQEWVERTFFPIGLDCNNNFFSLIPTEELSPQAVHLSNAIFALTNETELNRVTIVKSEQ